MALRDAKEMQQNRQLPEWAPAILSESGLGDSLPHFAKSGLGTADADQVPKLRAIVGRRGRICASLEADKPIPNRDPARSEEPEK